MDGSPYWNALAGRYGSLYDSEWSRFEDASLKRDLERLLAHANGRRVLDIGCGAGLGYELLGGPKQMIEYVGFDISAGMLAQFHAKHPEAQLVQGSADDMLNYFEPSQFDLVISTNVAASFVADVRKLADAIRTLLASKGLASLSFLNRVSLRRLYHLKTGPMEEYRTRGDTISEASVLAATYTAKELWNICASAGFAEVRCHYRSVLGGVWESRASVRVENILFRVVPCLGHAVVVTGVRT
ncbi:MAG: class I SAM-dependent methyltransferase [Methylocella sp.]